MRTSGLLLDVYDDFDGAMLRTLYPTAADIPNGVKTAAVVQGALYDQLPDDVFALVLRNDGEKLRKYACVDPGNTELSLQYFLKNAHKLPREAQKVAAQNLAVACGWYDMPVPEALMKIAGIGGAALGAAGKVLGPVVTGATVLGAGNQISQNMRAANAAGGQLMNKFAEVSGTTTAPAEEPTPSSATTAKTTINKTARVGHLVRHPGTDTEPEVSQPVSGEQPKAAPQAKHMRPTVDVSNAMPPQVTHEKKASLYALPSLGRYPIDSYAQVKAASEYFGKYSEQFSIEQRREYALNLVKQADAMAIAVPDVALRYGSEELAPVVDIKVAFDMRRMELQQYPDALQLLNEVESVILVPDGTKVASALQPQQAWELLVEFDRQSGLDRSYDKTVPDPYYSLFGREKVASQSAWSDVIGNDMVTFADLRRLSTVGTHTVRDTFGEEFQEDFRKDPVGLYESLPRDQKRMVIHMANGTSPGAEPAY